MDEVKVTGSFFEGMHFVGSGLMDFVKLQAFAIHTGRFK